MSKNSAGETLVTAAVMLAFAFAAIKWLFPPLLKAAAFVVGYVTALVTTGFVAGTASRTVVTVSSQVVTVSLAFISGAGAVTAGAAVVERATKNPFQWSLPLLAFMAAMVPEMVKSASTSNVISELAMQGTICVLFVIGGILLRQHTRWAWKLPIAFCIYLVVPGMLLFAQIRTPGSKLQSSLTTMGYNEWLALALLLLVGVLALTIAVAERRGAQGGKASEENISTAPDVPQ